MSNIFDVTTLRAFERRHEVEIGDVSCCEPGPHCGDDAIQEDLDEQ